MTTLSHAKQLHLQACRDDRENLQAALDMYRTRRPAGGRDVRTMNQAAARFEVQIAMLARIIESYERELVLD